MNQQRHSLALGIVIGTAAAMMAEMLGLRILAALWLLWWMGQTLRPPLTFSEIVRPVRHWLALMERRLRTR